MGLTQKGAEEASLLIHPAFQRTSFCQVQSGTQLQVMFQTLSRQEYSNWALLLPQFQGNPALLLPLSHHFSGSGLCGLAGSVTCAYDLVTGTLQADVQRRAREKDYYPQNFIWYLLMVLLEGCVDIQQQPYRKYFDIRPKNILRGMGHQVKLLCAGSFPGFRDGREAALQAEERAYLAPEEIRAVARGEQQPHLLDSVCETYSIGVTLLQVCSLESSESVYHGDMIEIAKAKLHSLAEAERYSRLLTQLLRAMLLQDCAARLSAPELWHLLLPYEIEILALRPFNFRQALSCSSVDRYYQKLQGLQGMEEYVATRRLRAAFWEAAEPKALQPPPRYFWHNIKF